MSDPTRFDLDDRQRAMLAEMGVRVWWPKATAEPAPPPAHSAQTVSTPKAASQALAPLAVSPIGDAAPQSLPERPVLSDVPPKRVLPVTAAPLGAVPSERPPLPPGLAEMDWSGLEAAVSGCKACALCASGKPPMLGVGRAKAAWLVVGDPPSEQDEETGQVFAGPEGVLLDNMLKAVGARRAAGTATGAVPVDGLALAEAHLTSAVKCRPPNGRNPEPGELAVCAAYLSRQVALVQPQVILAMGRFAIQSLLGSTEPMGKLRGRLHDYQGVPVVVTYPPSSLLRNPADKAKAWADLVLALQVVKG